VEIVKDAGIDAGPIMTQPAANRSSRGKLCQLSTRGRAISHAQHIAFTASGPFTRGETDFRGIGTVRALEAGG